MRRMRNWRFHAALSALAAIAHSKSACAFVTTAIRRQGHDNTSNIQGKRSLQSKGDGLIYDPREGPTDHEDDHIYVTPTTALYTGDPNDQRYSASDWLANVKSLPRSTILRAIQGPVISVMVWSCVVSILHFGIRKLRPRLADAICISSKPHSFLVSALGLLLVFRTNSAYQRFAEGRKIWENILSISRNISRLACLYEGDLGEERKHRIFRLLGAFPYLLHHHIQPQCLNPSELNQLHQIKGGTKYTIKLQDCADFCNGEDSNNLHDSSSNNNTDNGNVVAYVAQKIRQWRGKLPQRQPTNGKDNDDDDDIYCGLFDPDECETCLVDRRALPWCLLPPSALAKCADSDNRPLWICDRLAQELTNVGYSDNFTSRERLAFLSAIDKLSKCIGECERIHQTAVPLNYARHSLRSLTIWLFSLPFALVNEFGMLTAPVMGVLSWLLFGVYQIGSTIEDPFQGSLRLSILCDAIYRDVMYDADLRNRRDSAFQLEPELIEWDRMGPIGGGQDAAEADSKLFLSLPTNGNNTPAPLSPATSAPQSSSSSTNPRSGDEPATEERKPSKKESPKKARLPPPDDPMEPRP